MWTLKSLSPIRNTPGLSQKTAVFSSDAVFYSLLSSDAEQQCSSEVRCIAERKDYGSWDERQKTSYTPFFIHGGC